MTLAQYLSNPMGKGSSVLGNQEAIKAQYAKEIDDLNLHAQNSVTTYRVGSKWIVYHYKLPSKSGSKYDSKLHYDVLFQINQKDLKENGSPMSCEFLVFSNCPSFVYTYANALYRKKQIIPYLAQHYDPATRRNAATTKNPYDILGYERSMYIGASMIKAASSGLSADQIISSAATGSEYGIKAEVQTSHQVQMAFRNAKDQFKQAQEVQAAIPKLGAHRGENAGTSHTTGKVKTVKKTGTVARVPRTRKTKKI